MDFSLCRLPCAVHVHFDPAGVQHVLLKASRFHLVLIVEGPLMTMGPVRLNFTSIGIAGLDRYLTALGALAHILLDRRLAGAADCPAPVDRLRLTHAIVALDGDNAGATRREIATVIYGAERVADDWNHPSGAMKATIKRAVLRGRRYANGDYRNLMAGGTFAGPAQPTLLNVPSLTNP